MTAIDIVRLAIIAAASPSIACSGKATPPCMLEVAAYTSTAQRVSANIKLLGVAEWPGNLLDLKDDLRTVLSRSPQGKWYLDIVVKGETIFFPKELADHHVAPLRIVIGTEAGASATTTVLLTHCRQRASVFVDVEEPPDSRFVSFIRGRLVGCRLVGDLWLRGAPLFQGEVYAYLEGNVDAEDGSFWIPAAEPVRHILIFGRGQEPFFTTAVDVSLDPSGMAQDIELGDVALGPSCPPELRDP